MHPTKNKGKSVVAEQFVRILKNKICKFDCNIQKCMF